MNSPALDQMTELPTPGEQMQQGAYKLPNIEGNVVQDLSPFLQSLKDQQAKRRKKDDVAKYFTQFAGMTTDEVLQAQNHAAEARAAQEIAKGPQITPPVAEQVQFEQSQQAAQAEADLRTEQEKRPKYKEAVREPVSEKEFAISAALSMLFPSQSKQINSVVPNQHERNYQDEQARNRNEYAISDREHSHRVDVLKAILESVSDADKRKFETDKFNVGERNDIASYAYGQQMQSGRTETVQTNLNKRSDDRTESAEKLALIRQTSSANPQARADAASRLKLNYQFDIYDPQTYANATPGEKLQLERARDISEKRPYEIDQIKARTKVSQEQAAKIHQEVENFPQILRIKLGMLKGYLANIDSLIQDRTLDREMRGKEFWNKQIGSSLDDAQKELDDLKKDKKAKRGELQPIKDTLASGHYDNETDKKYWETRKTSLQDEIDALDQEIEDAETRISGIKQGLGPLDPIKADPTLSGQIGGRVGKRLKSLLVDNPFA